MCFWKRLLSSSSSRSKSLAASSKACIRPFQERSAGTWGATAELTPVPITSTSSGARLVFRLGSSFLWGRQRLSHAASQSFSTAWMSQIKVFFSESCVFRAVFGTFSPLEESTQTLGTVCVTNSVQDTQLRGKRGWKKQPNIQTEHTFTEASKASSSKLMQMESELPKPIWFHVCKLQVYN